MAGYVPHIGANEEPYWLLNNVNLCHGLGGELLGPEQFDVTIGVVLGLEDARHKLRNIAELAFGDGDAASTIEAIRRELRT